MSAWTATLHCIGYNFQSKAVAQDQFRKSFKTQMDLLIRDLFTSSKLVASLQITPGTLKIINDINFIIYVKKLVIYLNVTIFKGNVGINYINWYLHV